VDVSKIDSRFLTKLPVDVKLVITWDADDLCIDLHSTLPVTSNSYNFSFRTGWREKLLWYKLHFVRRMEQSRLFRMHCLQYFYVTSNALPLNIIVNCILGVYD
jgi:hypothetical protein